MREELKVASTFPCYPGFMNAKRNKTPIEKKNDYKMNDYTLYIALLVFIYLFALMIVAIDYST